MKKSEIKKIIKFHNMSDFLKGQSSKIITTLSKNDETVFVLKNGKPLAVIISKEKYDRLIEVGIDLNEI